MNIFHRVICIAALSVFWYLLGTIVAIKPLPNQALWTLYFTQLPEILPPYVKQYLILTIIILLAFSAITLKLQSIALILSFFLIELGIRVLMSTQFLEDQTSFHFCIVETQIDIQLKINYFNSVLAKYVYIITPNLSYNPELLQSFIDKLTILSADKISLANMNRSQINLYVNILVEQAYVETTKEALELDNQLYLAQFVFYILYTVIFYLIKYFIIP